MQNINKRRFITLINTAFFVGMLLLTQNISRVLAEVSPIQNTTIPTEYCSSLITTNLKQGTTSASVYELQKILNTSPDTQIASSGVGSPGQESTYFGPLTGSAVIRFQKKYHTDILAPFNLPDGTGFVGSNTRTKIKELCLALPSTSTQILKSQVLGTSTFMFTRTLRLNSSGSEVTELQKRLIAEGVYTGAVSGRFGRLTETGVKMYQSKYTIPVTGVVDSKTRDTLNAIIPPTIPLPPITIPPPITLPKTTLQWGAYAGDSANNLAAFESLVGKPVNIQSVFIGWGDAFPSSTASNLKLSGKTLLIFWEQYGTTVDSINAGNSDAYIAKFVQDAKISGASIILAPLHEMNGNWDPWDGTVGNNTPAKVITEWKRIHDAFSGVSNVKFAWDVNNESVPNTAANAISAYYPGDAYVDYVAVDGFNFGNPWQSFDTVFAGALSQLQTYHKPIYILSMGTVPDARKAAWITDALTVQIPKYPAISGWVWFNQNGADGNWLVNSDPASLVAFQTAVK